MSTDESILGAMVRKSRWRILESHPEEGLLLFHPRSTVKRKADVARSLGRAHRSGNSLITHTNLSSFGLFIPDLPSASSGQSKKLWLEELPRLAPKRKSVEVLSEDEVVLLVRRLKQSETRPVETLVHRSRTSPIEHLSKPHHL
ncbi:hypothetical protein Fot_04370 [Forsythia ovata]|uniref:Uncharacterized protein n=1 Tax=Forsythia ovata TaxID=205694 RepID=A0ABD1XCD0_9LAMI